MSELFESLAPLLPELEDTYRTLHARPELAFQEENTASIVAGQLTRLGWEVTTGIGRTGVVGVLRNGDGPVVMLRADMDALPVREQTGLSYASTATAVDDSGGTVAVMHACGHDLHVTCLLGACAVLAAERDWRGTVIALFQPGEESGYGARAVVDDGLFDRFDKPDVILGQHVGPGPAGLVATCPGTVMGATDSIRIRLFGRGGHGSKPESSVDPVVMAASLVMRLQTVVSRSIAANEPVVVTVGALHAGTTAAVIPDEAELSINVRTPSVGVRDQVFTLIERLARAEADAAGAPRQPEITSVYHLPPTVNDPAATARVATAHRAFFGDHRVLPITTTTASEDFGILGAAADVPYVYWFFGGIEPQRYQAAAAAGRIDEDIPQNHAATFAPVLQPSLTIGVQALVTAALAWLTPALVGAVGDGTAGRAQP
ncbi:MULTISPECIES: amidohydrolase [unclassified Solwaraspora]|uniref:amidohydrolase n=1 Tax=unclassified Solwaraspora TaxID=2627926 RepID=UPI00248C3DC7|nr:MULTISPECIES: amidohydrolase [unclassified Solwaraspora]WBB96672.1 amidohydrolase [Solwaraspora sp. WMMA2059]WBC19424.1 amidohydrolase [Solwaraspora sp. WMMA2080]WJK32993.1 amidohydrolase [Solwaraspora sp. WMMA2065]